MTVNKAYSSGDPHSKDAPDVKQRHRSEAKRFAPKPVLQGPIEGAGWQRKKHYRKFLSAGAFLVRAVRVNPEAVAQELYAMAHNYSIAASTSLALPCTQTVGSSGSLHSTPAGILQIVSDIAAPHYLDLLKKFDKKNVYKPGVVMSWWFHAPNSERGGCVAGVFAEDADCRNNPAQPMGGTRHDAGYLETITCDDLKTLKKKILGYKEEQLAERQRDHRYNEVVATLSPHNLLCIGFTMVNGERLADAGEADRKLIRQCLTALQAMARHTQTNIKDTTPLCCVLDLRMDSSLELLNVRSVRGDDIMLTPLPLQPADVKAWVPKHDPLDGYKIAQHFVVPDTLLLRVQDPLQNLSTWLSLSLQEHYAPREGRLNKEWQRKAYSTFLPIVQGPGCESQVQAIRNAAHILGPWDVDLEHGFSDKAEAQRQLAAAAIAKAQVVVVEARTVRELAALAAVLAARAMGLPAGRRPEPELMQAAVAIAGYIRAVRSDGRGLKVSEMHINPPTATHPGHFSVQISVQTAKPAIYSSDIAALVLAELLYVKNGTVHVDGQVLAPFAFSHTDQDASELLRLAELLLCDDAWGRVTHGYVDHKHAPEWRIWDQVGDITFNPEAATPLVLGAMVEQLCVGDPSVMPYASNAAVDAARQLGGQILNLQLDSMNQILGQPARAKVQMAVQEHVRRAQRMDGGVGGMLSAPKLPVLQVVGEWLFRTLLRRLH